MTTALLIVDVQNDFTEGGALAVEGGASVAARIREHLDAHADDYDLLIATRDWHSEDTRGHFVEEGEEPDFSTRWPRHCMAGTAGAEFHADFAPALDDHPIREARKGQEDAAYSGFEASLVDDGTPVPDLLAAKGVDRIDVCGLATDYCDRATVLDALRFFDQRGVDGEVRFLSDLAAAVASETGEAALREMSEQGAVVGPALT